MEAEVFVWRCMRDLVKLERHAGAVFAINMHFEYAKKIGLFVEPMQDVDVWNVRDALGVFKREL